MAELQAKHEKQIKAAIEKLNKTMIEIKKYMPEAMYYLENGSNFNVLSGDSHDKRDQPNYDNIIVSFNLSFADCGGW